MLKLATSVIENLKNEDRQSKYRGRENPLAGHCYVASEVLYHLLGGKLSGWKPCSIRVGNVVHWYLEHSKYGILDATAGQFHGPIDYRAGRSRGFLTRAPSKRSRVVMERMKDAHL